MPRNNNSSERTAASWGAVDGNESQASLHRPPAVAARLATKAPISSETNSHNDAATATPAAVAPLDTAPARDSVGRGALMGCRPLGSAWSV